MLMLAYSLPCSHAISSQSYSWTLKNSLIIFKSTFNVLIGRSSKQEVDINEQKQKAVLFQNETLCHT